MKTLKYFLPLFALFSCTMMEKDSLDEVKNFNSANKYFKTSAVNMHFLIETRDTEKLDTLFYQWIKSHNIPFDARGCKDGDYVGESPYDAFDYKHVVKIKIENEKIISIDYNEIKKDGNDKETDKEYNEEMSATGTSPSIAYPDYEKQMLNKQDYMKVDAVTGATYSMFRFRYALAIALMKAKT